jgi:hypothetical protein
MLRIVSDQLAASRTKASSESHAKVDPFDISAALFYMLHGHLGWQFALEPVLCDVSVAVRVECASASRSLFAMGQTPI